MEIQITKTTHPKPKPADETKLGFGKSFTDHMFLMDYTVGRGWHDPRIAPYGPISLDPSATVFHYGQEVFEGMKAYRDAQGRIRLFRPEENFKRLNQSSDRLCIPRVDEAFCLEALETLLETDRDWIPASEGTSLYIRPFIIGCEPVLGVHPASNYRFLIILSPSGAYYAGGLEPVKIYVEPNYVRAVRGGMGFAKTGGNYAASLRAQEDAKGYAQVLWLDGVERSYIEEVGSMNVFFVFDDEIVTPQLQGSVLPGITRKSCIELMRDWGMTVNERRLSIREVEEKAKSGRLREMFGTGTAAVVSPVGELHYQDESFSVGSGKIGELTQKLYDELTGIQLGKRPDPHNWSKVIL